MAFRCIGTTCTAACKLTKRVAQERRNVLFNLVQSVHDRNFLSNMGDSLQFLWSKEGDHTSSLLLKYTGLSFHIFVDKTWLACVNMVEELVTMIE